MCTTLCGQPILNTCTYAKQVRDDLALHAFYKISMPQLNAQFEALAATQKRSYANDLNDFIAQYEDAWKDVVDAAARALPFIEKTFRRISLQAIFVYAWGRWRHGIPDGNFAERPQHWYCHSRMDAQLVPDDDGHQ